MDFLVLLVKFVWEALYTYAASDEGKAELIAILDAVEAAGIDIPFYEPSDGQSPTDEGSSVDGGTEFVNDGRAATFRERHPEFYKDVK